MPAGECLPGFVAVESPEECQIALGELKSDRSADFFALTRDPDKLEVSVGIEFDNTDAPPHCYFVQDIRDVDCARMTERRRPQAELDSPLRFNAVSADHTRAQMRPLLVGQRTEDSTPQRPALGVLG